MRGFLVFFNSDPEKAPDRNDHIERRIAEWEMAFRSDCLHRFQQSNCKIWLFTLDSKVPADFNQRVTRTPNELLLWTGPRVDMTPGSLLTTPKSHDLRKLSTAAVAAPGALDTAVCIHYNANENSLIVKTDILNTTFIYWAQFGHGVLLSNSSLVLARILGTRINLIGASEFLASGSIYANQSLFEGIHTFKPATVYAFRNCTTPVMREYWRIDTLPFNTLSVKEACRRVIDELDKDFDALNATGKTFILDLTGGYDSRTNVGFALRHLKNFQTTVSGKPNDEDVLLSSRLAQLLGIKHTVIQHPAYDDPRTSGRSAECARLTDLEYDIIEYSRIYNTQIQFDSINQPSIHGSGGGDIARNIILRREFYDKTPDGQLVVEPLIAQRFRNLIPANMGRPGLPIANWVAHMRDRIAIHDVTHLPAFVRLDIIYLRMRMQFWQGRIGSSTNRFRSSFSPWTNRRVLESMLMTHWRDRDHQMLSRLFLRTLHPALSKVGIARGEPAGPRCYDTVKGMPARLRYFAGRLAARMSVAKPAKANPDVFRHLTRDWEEIAVGLLKPESLSALTAVDGPATQPQVLGRLITLAQIKNYLEAPIGKSMPWTASERATELQRTPTTISAS
jgi:hypothetical protein